MIKIDNGFIDLRGNKMDLSVDLSVIVAALIDRAGFSEELIRRGVNIGIKGAGKLELWEDADD